MTPYTFGMDQPPSGSEASRGPELPVSEDELAHAVRMLLHAGRDMHASMSRRLRMGDNDLNAMDELVRSEAPMGPVELGNRLGIRSASATVLVTRLEEAGHLERRPHGVDRRRITLHATDSAKAEVGRTLMPLILAINEATAKLSPAEARVVMGYLTDVTAALRDFAAD